MTRKARFSSLLGYHHVLVRGNNSENIFLTDYNKENYLNLITQVFSKYNTKLVCYCLLSNYAHLVVKADKESLSRSMASLNTRYAMIYNLSNNRMGHVFQGRFKSVGIENLMYLAKVIRYIHKTPHLLNLSCDYRVYKWCSYSEFAKSISFLETYEVQNIINIFDGKIDLFKSYHEEDDLDIFLDINEVVERNKQIIAYKIINNYKASYNFRIKDLKKDKEVLADLVGDLLLTGKLSNSKISALLGISNFIITKLKRKDE